MDNIDIKTFNNKWFKTFRIARMIFYIIFFLTFIIIDTSYFETHGSICLIYNKFGILCPTCGVTRAFSCMMHLDFISAFNYNPVFTVAFGPISIFLMLEDLVRIIVQLINKKYKYSILEYLVWGLR